MTDNNTNSPADKIDQAADIVDAVREVDPRIGKNAGTWIRIGAALARLFGRK